MDIHGKMEIVLLEYMERIVFGEYPTQTLPMLPLTGIRYYTLKYSITMKKLLFTLLSIGILTSCSPRYSEALYKSDYTQYVKEGFYIYPEGAVPSVLDYTPLSSLSLVFTYGKPDKKISAPGITIIKDGAPQTFSDYAIPSKQYMVGKLVDAAKQHGANAIINLKGKEIGKQQYVISAVAVKIQPK